MAANHTSYNFKLSIEKNPLISLVAVYGEVSRGNEALIDITFFESLGKNPQKLHFVTARNLC